ncbi:Tyrosine-protein phosphatase [termite gut metagenome]|uniref:Tyrosine-protein phosphatase n=1 Tax=termite gut metagenome TaxID=433724 RepID=A0A5J4QEF4_9ZZZZ
MQNHKFKLSILFFVLMVEVIACSGNRNTNLQISYKNAPKEYVENRILPLEGALNARDLGGYASADGSHVKWGMIFRTGDLNELTDTDLHYLNQIPIKTIIDFRDSSEIVSAPDKVTASLVNQFFLPIQPGNIIDFNKITPEVAPQILVDVNKMLVSDFQSEYKSFFQLLMNDNNTPLLFHCSAGKDRTGFASALFLASLGVDKETIIQDYLLSKKQVEEKYAGFVAENPVLEPLMTVKREYIEAALDLIDKEYGGMENYLTHYLQVDTLKMRKIYTE